MKKIEGAKNKMKFTTASEVDFNLLYNAVDRMYIGLIQDVANAQQA